MAIDFEDLRLLIDIVESGSFSKAAARRRWSQPQVSQRISALEADIGAQLFQRHRRGAIPTPACEAFLPAANDALAALDAGRKAVATTPALPKMLLACVPSLAGVVFSQVLVALGDAPLEIRCSTDHSPAIMERLINGKVHFGFVLKCPAIAGIQMQCISHSRIVAVVHRDHRLASRSNLTLRDLANEQLAPQHFGDECDELVKMIRAHRHVPGPIHAIQPSSAARELALEHGYLTFMPEMAVRRDLRHGRLVKLDVADLPEWEWEVMVAWRSGKRADPAKDKMLDAILTLSELWQ